MEALPLVLAEVGAEVAIGSAFAAGAETFGAAAAFGGAEAAFGGAAAFGGGEALAGLAAGEFGGAVLPASIFSAADPIAALEALDAIGGYQGATAGAQSLGYASPQAVLSAVNPGWVSAGGEFGGQALYGDAEMEAAGLEGSSRNANTALNGLSTNNAFTSAMKGIFSPIGGGMQVPGLGMPVGISPFDIAKGGYGLYNSNKLKGLTSQLSAQADPNGPYRAGYASRLNALSMDPSSITGVPGYQAGLEAVQRSMAAQGYQGSGNMMTALNKYGGDFYNQEMARLAGLSGGNPGNAAALSLQGNTDAFNLAGQSINSLGYGAAGGAGQRRGITFNA